MLICIEVINHRFDVGNRGRRKKCAVDGYIHDFNSNVKVQN